jgi:hypothetical protein
MSEILKKISSSLIRKISPEKTEKRTDELESLLINIYKKFQDFSSTESSTRERGILFERGVCFHKKIFLTNGKLGRKEYRYLLELYQEPTANGIISHLQISDSNPYKEDERLMRFREDKLVVAEKKYKIGFNRYEKNKHDEDLATVLPGREQIEFLKEVNSASVDTNATFKKVSLNLSAESFEN